MQGEDAEVDEQVHGWAGDVGRELLHELDRLEEQLRSAIAPDRLEIDEDAAVGAQADAVLGERRAEEIAAELFEAGAIVGGDPDVGVEVEALELGLARAAGGDVTEVRVSFPSSGVLSLLAPCAKWLLSGGRHNRTSDGLTWMRAVAGVDSIMSRPP
jgi:hypothetical protein